MVAFGGGIVVLVSTTGGGVLTLGGAVVVVTKVDELKLELDKEEELLDEDKDELELKVLD